MGLPSDKQWLRLLEIINCDEELRTGQFKALNGKARCVKKWKNIATELNSFVNWSDGGARKNGQQWKDALSQLRSWARKAYTKKKNYSAGTGGGEPAEAVGLGLRDVYAKCIIIFGAVTACGNTSVPNPLEIQRKNQASYYQSNKSLNEDNLMVGNRENERREWRTLPPTSYTRESDRREGRTFSPTNYTRESDRRERQTFSPTNYTRENDRRERQTVSPTKYTRENDQCERWTLPPTSYTRENDRRERRTLSPTSYTPSPKRNPMSPRDVKSLWQYPPSPFGTPKKSPHSLMSSPAKHSLGIDIVGISSPDINVDQIGSRRSRYKIMKEGTSVNAQITEAVESLSVSIDSLRACIEELKDALKRHCEMLVKNTVALATLSKL